MNRLIGRFRFLKNMKLQTKITLCIVLVVAVPLVILLAVFTNPLYEMIFARTIRDAQNNTSLIAPRIEMQVDSVVQTADSIFRHPYCELLFNDELLSAPDEMAESELAYEFKDFVETVVNESTINAVRIYVGLNEADLFFEKESAVDLFRPEQDVRPTYWNGIMHSTNSPVLFCPELYLKKAELNSYGNCAYIIRSSICYKGCVYPVYLTCYYDNSIYGNELTEATETQGAVSYIINDRDALVYTTDAALSGAYRLKYEDIEKLLMSSNSFVEKEIAGVSVYAAFYYIAESDWFMVNVIPKAPVENIALRWMIRFIIVCFASLLIAVVIAVSVSKSATSRIAEVSDQMSKVHNGPPVALPQPLYNDEVGELIKTYNYMTGEMNNLIHKQEETAQELRFAEFNALQAQINPHFLYNTMDMINWMAIQGRNKEVSEVVQKLSKFYKLTLSRKKDYSTIADELEHAHVYIELQNMRFNDAIDFVVDVPDELTECRLPKLTFQPILENAIFHGILEKEEKSGTIVLTIWSDGEDITILISDDGAGMTEDIRKQILSEERIKPTSSRGANVAIVNIHRRLQLLYGEKYGLSYESSPGNGCEVTILIPKHIGDQAYNKKE